MKNALIAFAFILGASAAHATTTCGTLKQVAKAPNCSGMQFCPQYVSIVNVLVQGSQQIVLQAQNQSAQARMSQYQNLLVCIEGSYSNGIFNVQQMNLAETAQ